ncbi:MAG: hypothetical protein A2W31_04205 [Planctomycetes bacterium RBG_16_64_10]|nr:MAG: hypothetical protein A2W31_04205 [Planctomycetes bacterium RBG_16_64_10]
MLKVDLATGQLSPYAGIDTAGSGGDGRGQSPPPLLDLLHDSVLLTLGVLADATGAGRRTAAVTVHAAQGIPALQFSYLFCLTGQRNTGRAG